jgi:stress-induced morphogen
MEQQEILEQIKAAFQSIIQEKNLHPTRVDIEWSPHETIHVYMTAPEFSGKTITERHRMIWLALEKKLVRKVLMHISVFVLLAPEEEKEAELAPTV